MDKYKKIYILLCVVAFIATSLAVNHFLYMEEEVIIKVEEIDYNSSSGVWIIEQNIHIVEVKNREKFLALAGNKSCVYGRVNDRPDGVLLRYWSKSTSPEYILKEDDLIFPGEEIIVLYEKTYEAEKSFWQMSSVVEIKEIQKGQVIAIKNNFLTIISIVAFLFLAFMLIWFYIIDKKD